MAIDRLGIEGIKGPKHTGISKRICYHKETGGP